MMFYERMKLFRVSVFLTLVSAILTTTGSVMAAIPGDANGDGLVNGADYSIWVSHYGQTVSCGASCGDFTGDGQVNGSDYFLWLSNYGTTGPTPTRTPSPSRTPTPTLGIGTTTTPPPVGGGVWISQQEIMNLPASGTAWNIVVTWAGKSIGSPSINDQDSDQDGIALAKAYTCARIGEHCPELISALNTLSSSAPSGDRALAWGRNLPMWIISADVLINSGRSSGLNIAQFRNWADTAIRTTSQEAGTIIQCHEQRSNNWSTMCGGARMAVHSFLGDTTGLNRAWDVYRGYMGDRSSGAYTGFSGGQQCTNWRCPGNCDKIWVNPKGCMKSGHLFDGALPHEMQRQGEWNGTTWPPPFETSYPWNGLAGLVVQAEIMSRRSYPSWTIADSAILRAYSWDVDEAQKSVETAGEASWMPWVINRRYNRNYPVQFHTDPGQNAGYLEWTHAR
jgi:hypothetical protein